MSDFDYGEIEIRYNSADYGPFSFDLEDAAPTGAVISAVTVKSYEGNVKAGDLLSGETETSDDLVDSVFTAATETTRLVFTLTILVLTTRVTIPYSLKLHGTIMRSTLMCSIR